MSAIKAFLDFIDNRVVVRRIVLFATLYMTWDAYRWAAIFATTTDKTGAEVGLIIAAVTAPISVLQGFIFKAYSEVRADT